MDIYYHICDQIIATIVFLSGYCKETILQFVLSKKLWLKKRLQVILFRKVGQLYKIGISVINFFISRNNLKEIEKLNE